MPTLCPAQKAPFSIKSWNKSYDRVNSILAVVNSQNVCHLQIFIVKCHQNLIFVKIYYFFKCTNFWKGVKKLIPTVSKLFPREFFSLKCYLGTCSSVLHLFHTIWARNQSIRTKKIFENTELIESFIQFVILLFDIEGSESI